MRAISKVAINMGSSYTSMGLTIIINILLVPFVIGILGKEVFGTVALIQSFQFIVGMASSGLMQAFVRLYVLNNAKSEKTELVGSYSNAVFVTIFIISTVVITITVLLIIFIVPWFNINSEMLLSSRILMGIFGICAVVNSLSLPHLSVYASVQKFYIQNFWEVVYHVIFAVCTVFFLWQWPSIISYGLALLAARVAFYVGVFIAAKKDFPFCVYQHNLVTWSKIRAIFSISILVLIPNLSANIYTQLNQMIINLFLGPLFNTYFAVCLLWHRMLGRVLTTVGSVISPQITAYQAKEQWRQIGEGLLRTTKYSFLVGLAIGGTLAIIPGPVFKVWLGPGYDLAAKAMFWFALVAPWMAAQMPGIAILVALGKVKFPSVLAPVIAVTNLTIVLIGVKWFGFGIVSISIVLFACMFTRYGLILPAYSAVQCRIPYWHFIRQSYCRGAIAFVPAALFLFTMKDRIDKWTIVNLSAIITIAILIYFFSIWFIALDSWDKNLIFSYAVKLKYIKKFMSKQQTI